MNKIKNILDELRNYKSMDRKNILYASIECKLNDSLAVYEAELNTIYDNLNIYSYNHALSILKKLK